MSYPNRSSRFSHHEACDNCGSRDNKGVWADGSTWCFGCHKLTRATRVPMHQVETKPENITKRYTSRVAIGRTNRLYLRQYLTDDEIDEFFFEDQVTGRFVFAHHEGEEDYFYDAQCVDREVTNKSIQSGTKPRKMIIGKWKESGILVVVEDLVSAIVVGRQFGAIPLFGCHMSALQIAELCAIDGINYIPVWLDDDKYPFGMNLSRLISYHKPSSVIRTDEDAKAHTNNQIYNEVMETLNENLLLRKNEQTTTTST